MGIVNVTPDSFSDGGLFFDADAAVRHGLDLAAEGADILDVGGESTRPGAEPVGVEEELRRVVPVVERLAAEVAERDGAEPHARGAGAAPGAGAVQISVDTSKAAVAGAALAAGASFVNDVTALRGDPEMAELVARSGAECCLMHMLGEPRTMQADPRYEDVVDDVKAFLEERMAFAVGAGIAEERIVLDPGIGFGKTAAHNRELLRRLDELLVLGRPILVGTSRKSFIGGDPAARLPGTIAANVLALERGASVFRVHDVAPLAAALGLAAATLGRRWTARSASTARTPTS
jgi:dihydropteroate synthase